MMSRKWIGLVALFSVALIATVAIRAIADDDGPAEGAKKIAEVLKQVKVNLADAIKTAETKSGGRAVAAKLESEEDELAWEVICVVVDKDTVNISEVEVDAKTGSVIDDDKEEEGKEDGENDEGGEEDDD